MKLADPFSLEMNYNDCAKSHLDECGMWINYIYTDARCYDVTSNHEPESLVLCVCVFVLVCLCVCTCVCRL